MAGLTHAMGDMAVDKDRYTGKCITVMASLTEVKKPRMGCCLLNVPNRTETGLVPV